ncbi:hypothetical protein DNI29_12950 [Hymenobacter sediminis]|uniref:hypothetical protein n=1 Tax=Hymenobacter sediminis TaxID=2218621 RepID=UPI000F5027B0|nr:hypothetical protein [Hymenobacter sediminis]RPD47058.1 hypothetical protein DNI29_12950 [Hymenobacter sediminis]
MKRYLLLVVTGSLAGGCSVYAPLQTSAPLVHDKGEAEVVGSAYLSGRLEGSVAYSPLKHVLVRAAGGFRPSSADSTYFRIRQFEAGVGSYRYFREQWLIGGMVGYGHGRSTRRWRDDFKDIWQDSVLANEYAARFHKLFAEAYVANDAGWTTFGAACRVSQVRFSSLSNRGIPVPLRRMTRLEPMLFMRVGGQGRLPWLQGQIATSVSIAPDGRTRSPNTDIRATKEGRLYTTVGVVIYPHLFREYAGRNR